MTRENYNKAYIQMKKEYIEWLYDVVRVEHPRRRSYKKLFNHLFNTDFTYIIDLDSNRASDGLLLRKRFYEATGTFIEYVFDPKPCSVLEMMVGLAYRCEVSIMDDPELGDRTEEWFWGMIGNLGLLSMNDSKYDRNYVEHVIDILLNREYSANGDGGLFTIFNPREDLRDVEIWYQMCWYMEELSEKSKRRD